MSPWPSFRIGIRPKHAEVWAYNQERALQVVLPPATRLELAERAVREAVGKWLQRLDRENLRLITDIEIEGPFFCPFLENYGCDLWLARARFQATRPRLVREDVLVGQRRLAEDLGIRYQEYRTAPELALPEDMHEQLRFVSENRDQVYRDLRELEKKKGERDAKGPSAREILPG